MIRLNELDRLNLRSILEGKDFVTLEYLRVLQDCDLDECNSFKINNVEMEKYDCVMCSFFRNVIGKLK